MNLRKSRSLRFIGSALIAAVAVFPLVLSQSTQALAEDPDSGIGIRLVDVTADLADDPRAQTYIIDHLNPGVSITRKIAINNFSATEPETVNVYAGSAKIDDGSFIGEDESVENDLTDWTTTGPGEVEVPPKTEKIVEVTIAVPTYATEGEQYGVIWAQAVPKAVDENASQVLTRAGVRMYVHVGPGGAPAPSFAIDTLTTSRGEDKTPKVSATVKNTGGRALDLSGELSLAQGPGGITAGPFPTSLKKTLKPGESGVVEIELDKSIPNGPWKAEIMLESGRISEKVSATITFPEEGVGETVSFGIEQLMLVVLIVVALLLVIALVVIVLKRRKKKADAASVLDEEALESVTDESVEQLIGQAHATNDQNGKA